MRKDKGKVFPVLNWAPRHEVVLGEWKYSSTNSLASALDGGEWSVSRIVFLDFIHRLASQEQTKLKKN